MEVRPFTFALDVAALASRREYLNLEKWLSDSVSNHGAEFLHSVIAFLDQKMENEKAARLSDPPKDSRTFFLSASTVATILRLLRNKSVLFIHFPSLADDTVFCSTNLMAEPDVEYGLEVRNACLQIYPRLMTLTPGTDVEPGFAVVSYAPEIEAEVDAIYKQMYGGTIGIDEVISALQRKKESANPRDHEIFSCMIHLLFDEYRFYQSLYPVRELAMTGYLFGSLIQHQLIDYIPLGIAIRFVIDALNCPPETNLFKFGVEALSRFEGRLPEWKPLCQALLRIDHLLDVRPDLAQNIQVALSASETGIPIDTRSGPSQEPTPVFTSIQPDQTDEEIAMPPEDVSDKILFIVNNLAPTNFDAKVAEMRAQFDDAYAPWFANYLVDQRVSSEPNNHPLYLRFLDALDRKILFKFILHETFVKSAALLNSERTLQPGMERNTLKNVGSWLGAITLARDRPIKHKNLSFKDLLIEGYDNNRLVVAITFVCKTLEPCARSKVFRYPNPWLMAVLSLLAEMYHFAELKLNPKFEIEMLCKSLEIDLDAIEATNTLRNRPLADTLPAPIPDYVSDIDALPIGGYEPSATHVGDAQGLTLGPTSPSDQRSVGAQIEAILATLAHHVQVNPQLAPLNVNPNFKRAVQLAVDRAVREVSAHKLFIPSRTKKISLDYLACR